MFLFVRLVLNVHFVHAVLQPLSIPLLLYTRQPQMFLLHLSYKLHFIGRQTLKQLIILVIYDQVTLEALVSERSLKLSSDDLVLYLDG